MKDLKKKDDKIKFSIHLNNCDLADTHEFFSFINDMMTNFGADYKKEQGLDGVMNIIEEGEEIEDEKNNKEIL